jgi:hypothetical protein
MFNEKKSEVRLSGPESTALGCALSTDWVRTVGSTIVYPAFSGEKTNGDSLHREDFNHPQRSGGTGSHG